MDDLHHFMQDCWHLKDWIKHDPATGAANTIESAVSQHRSLRIVADLANGAKHYSLNRPREGARIISQGVTAHLGQAKAIDVPIVVELSSGLTLTMHEIIADAYRDWRLVLAEVGLDSSS